VTRIIGHVIAGIAAMLVSAHAQPASAQTPPLAALLPDPAIGDTLVYRVTDLWSGRVSDRYSMELTGKRTERFIYKRTALESARVQRYALTRQLGTCISAATCVDAYGFPLALGARRNFELAYSPTYEVDENCQVAAIEKVTVPAGTFDTFRVECVGKWISRAVLDAIYRGRVTETHWYAPAVNAEVKLLFRHYQRIGGLDTQNLTELLEFAPGPEGSADIEDAAAATLTGTSRVSRKRPSGSELVNDALATLQAMPPESVAGSTKFTGRFMRDPGNTGYSGTGRVAWASGDVYEGTLVKGVREGKGTFAWANGQRFEGDWKDDRPEGQGKLKFANGDEYEGTVAAGAPTGAGRMAYGSGDRYAGEFLNGEPNGHGKYAWASGQCLDGDWIKGQGQGAGILEFANGNRFEGELARGLPNGSGRLSYASGDTYVGNVKDGAPDGEGTYTWKSGDRYAGQWQDGAKEGQGVMVWTASRSAKTVLAKQSSRNASQRCSAGFNSGLYGGRKIKRMFFGTLNSPARCQPA
jgi:hypothetical protein